VKYEVSEGVGLENVAQKMLDGQSKSDFSRRCRQLVGVYSIRVRQCKTPPDCNNRVSLQVLCLANRQTFTSIPEVVDACNVFLNAPIDYGKN
jgi:hypothetical protein